MPLGAGLAAFSLFGRGGNGNYVLQRGKRQAIFKTLEAQDKLDCAKLYLCQRATLKQLKDADRQIIQLIKDDKLSVAFEAALDFGLGNQGRPQACAKRYMKCK